MPIRRLLQYDFGLVFKVTRVLEKINSKVLHLGAAKMSQRVKELAVQAQGPGSSEPTDTSCVWLRMSTHDRTLVTLALLGADTRISGICWPATIDSFQVSERPCLKIIRQKVTGQDT